MYAGDDPINLSDMTGLGWRKTTAEVSYFAAKEMLCVSTGVAAGFFTCGVGIAAGVACNAMLELGIDKVEPQD